jgi:hypothetical protein
MGDGYNRRRHGLGCRLGRSNCWTRRGMTLVCLGLFFHLLGQNGLGRVAGLGDMREIELWRNRLGAARRL